MFIMKRPIKFLLNDREVETTLSPGSVALDFIRRQQGLTGAKAGCREGECGACTVLLGELNRAGGTVSYKAASSCLLPLGELEGKHLVTIEGLNNFTLTPVQRAIVDEAASQCGFCTPGIVVSLTGFFINSQGLDYADAIEALDGNLCRCTGYVSIQRAAKRLCDNFSPLLDNAQNRIQQLVEWSIAPGYFLTIPGRLENMDLPVPGDEGAEKVIVAGATDLFVQQPMELLDKNLEFVSRREELSGIKQKDHWLVIGAGTTVEEVKQSPLVNRLFPGMDGHLGLVSSTIMRSRATLAGNIVNASPIGDLTIILLALDANISLARDKRKREFPLKDFFKGYKKLDLCKGEVMETIEIPLPLPGVDFKFHFEKVSRRRHLDIASVNTAISLKTAGDAVMDVHLSAGGVAAIPLYLEETCAFLRGKTVTGEVLQEAARVMEQEISPISDVRGSAEYKTRLLKNLFFAHFNTLFQVDASGGQGALLKKRPLDPPKTFT
jgi:xanthine dehydrogenase small subunit